MNSTWNEALWTDWFTAWADWSSIISAFENLVPPPDRVIDLGRVTAMQAKFEVTDVVGGAKLFLVTSVSRSGPWSPIAEVNTTDFPGTNVYTLRVGGGALTITNPMDPAVQANAFGRYLGWTVKAPTGTVSFWGITFKATVNYQGQLAFGDDMSAASESIEVQPLIAIAGDNTIHPQVTQSAPAWLDTSHWTQLLLEVDVLLVTNAKVYLQTSISGGAADDGSMCLLVGAGQRLVAVFADGTERVLPVTDRPAHRRVLSPDGARLCTTVRGGVVRVWDTRSGADTSPAQRPSG